jgi:RNA polymerase sigma-70 factor (ECF subfamily)
VNVGDTSCTFDEGFPAVAEEAVPDRGRIAAIVGEHLPFVWRLLRRFGVPPSDIDDAAQRVFLVASAKLDQIEPGRERSFLAGTALRVASAARRDAKRRPEIATSDFDDQLAAGPTPDEEVESREALVLLDRILDAMPDELRVVLVLCDVEQLTVPEVALLQRAPIGTISSRLRRARKELGEAIKRLQAKSTYGGCP